MIDTQNRPGGTIRTPNGYNITRIKYSIRTIAHKMRISVSNLNIYEDINNNNVTLYSELFFRPTHR